MVFELHIWAPAFGLPSIDPECLAAIAYLHSVLHEGDWILIPDSDPTISPFDALPALRGDDTWISGFQNIVEYLRQSSGGRWSLDEGLSKKQRADCSAYTAFVESRGAPLLDLSLFVSSENYTNVTRSLVGDMLSWPNSWTLPGRLRGNAKKRSEHLGLNGLDIDAATEELKKKEESGLSGQIPKSLRRDVKSLSGLLGTGAKANQFRLVGVTDDFLDPMEELLGEKQWLLGTDGPTSLDCLALGYLSLMLNADLPHPWLKTSLEGKHAKLGKWTSLQAKSMLGGSLSLDHAVNGVGVRMKPRKSTLPWEASRERSWMEVGMALLRSFTSTLPLVGPGYLHPHLGEALDAQVSGTYHSKQVALLEVKNRQLLYGQIIASCLGAASAMGLLFWTGLLSLPRRPMRARKRDFGAAGAMLGLGLT